MLNDSSSPTKQRQPASARETTTAPNATEGTARVRSGWFREAVASLRPPRDMTRADFHPLALARREFTIQGASFILMVTFFTSAVLGAVRQFLLNYHFGADETAGAYYAAFRLPDAIFTLVAGGALSSAFIPVLVGTRSREGELAAWRLTSLVLNALVAVLTVIAAIGMIVAPWMSANILVPGYSEAGQETAAQLTRIMLLQPVILGAGTVITALLNSRNRFFLPAIGVAAHNGGVISGTLVAMAYPDIGIWGPAWGVVAGSVLQVAVMLPGLAGEDARHRWQPILDWQDARLREVARLLVPNGLSMGVNYSGWVVEASFASRLSDEASIPALHNGWLVAGLPVTLLGAAIGQAAFPRLATHVSDGNGAQFRRTLYRSLLVAVGTAIPVALGLLLIGRPLIEVLFGHGEYVNATDLTYLAMAGYVIGLPSYIATELASRAILAQKDARTPLLTNILQLALRTALMASLLGPLGLIAIPLAYTVSSVLEALILTGIAISRARRL